MAIEYKGKVYRNLQEQVLKNKDDIVELIDGVSDITGAVAEEIGEVVNQVSELNQEIAKALKIPTATPAATQLVGITPAKDQQMITVGEGLSLENNILDVKAPEEEEKDEYEIVETGTYLHILSVYCYDEYYMPNEGTGVISVVSTRKDPISFTSQDGDSTARLELAQMLSQTPEKTFYFFASSGEKCSISSYEGNELYFSNSDTGESIDSGKVGVSDAVFPQYKKQIVIPTPDFSKTFDLNVDLAAWYINNGEVNTDGIGSQGSYEPVFVKAYGGDQEVSLYPDGTTSAVIQVPTNTRLIEFSTQTSGGEAKVWPGAGLPGYRCDVDGGYSPVIYKIPKNETSITFYSESGYSDELERIWPLA